ncbi:ROK family transcriptional regulator [Silicimonas algicola]|uniref:Putative NBD/HSP70 family sugar kinase n=1 Tax=Silicimonas algicola TaxID=1826607 RepID=A0A316GV54_9RHOB|nr:ROK family transcriptional regulator [Silicimonas algicola]PWK58937.1 putative NBD/HSP70 family sugar kinase [Silicimonas algicola]
MTTNETFIRVSGSGANQSGLRDQNARVVLSFIRRHGELPSAEIARRSGLSAQTVSNIVRALEAEGLVRRGMSIKGKVGKPSVPMALEPGGVTSLGLNIGRRAAEMVLVDFTGSVLAERMTPYSYPTPDAVRAFVLDAIGAIFADRPGDLTHLAGLGIAMPYELWNWLDYVDAPEELMNEWRTIAIGAYLGEATGLETVVENDATSACVAEHLLGRGHEYADFAYFFLGAFLGGGLVLNGKVYSGRNGNAGAFGSLLVPDGTGDVAQLLDVASNHVLERSLAEAGIDASVLRTRPDDWSALEPHLSEWIAATGRYLALAATSIAAVVDVEAVLVEGAVPAPVRAALVSRARSTLETLDRTGIATPDIREASVGRAARSIGAALLPIHARYFLA